MVDGLSDVSHKLKTACSHLKPKYYGNKAVF